MLDRKKTIEGLKRILHSGRMYEAHLVIDTCEAAITLLEAQDHPNEPVKPERSGHGTTWYYCCGACGQPIDPGDPYCRKCGKKVGWE